MTALVAIRAAVRLDLLDIIVTDVSSAVLSFVM